MGVFLILSLKKLQKVVKKCKNVHEMCRKVRFFAKKCWKSEVFGIFVRASAQMIES